MKTLPAKARLADHLIPGGLRQLIAGERDKGASFETIARSIFDASNGEVEVTGVSVRSWALALGFDTARIPVAAEGDVA